jgi:pimeloyl-ACP methyl ester carboxylesterase
VETSIETGNRLAFEDRGTGFPVVFIHGLTFSKATWRPITDLLTDRFRCVTIDLPGHGESPGLPRSIEEVGHQVNQLVTDLGIELPVVVGHSLGAMFVTLYATRHPVAGVVNVDQTLDIGPIAHLVQQVGPALRGPGFAAAFEPFRQSIGVESLPEPLRSRTLATQTVQQDLVLAYWSEPLLQARVDEALREITVPYLAVFGHPLSHDERTRLHDRLRTVELEEWPDRGHMVHLMEPERFANRIARFIDQCSGL